MISSTSHRWFGALIGVVATILMLMLCSCGTDSSDAGSDASTTGHEQTQFGSASYPLTVETKYGSVTIEKAPERIISTSVLMTSLLHELDAPLIKVTDTASALSKNPPEHPWLPDDLRPGGELFDETLLSGPFAASPEAVAVLEPDLIFVSEFEKPENVEKLSAIAPVVAPDPDADVDAIDATLRALGYTDGEIAEYSAEAHTALEDGLGTDFATAPAPTFSIITAEAENIAVPPTQFKDFTNWSEAGLTLQLPDSLPTSGDRILSWENLGQLDSDILFVITRREIAEPKLTADPRWAELPAVKNDLVFYVSEPEYEGANNASVLIKTEAQYFANSPLAAAVRTGIHKLP